MDEDVIKFGTRTALFWILGAFSAVLALPFCFLALWRFPFASGFVFADLLVMVGLMIFFGMAAWCFGFAIQRPTGLRLDGHGISGFFAPTLSWADIKWVPLTVGSGGKTIWIDLQDRQAFWARQSAWARLMSALSLQAGLVGIHVNTIKARPEEILETLRDMHGRHSRAEG